MKTLLLALLLVTGSAWAEWVKVAEGDGVDLYIDLETIRKDGNRRRVWQIQNLKQRGKDGESSRRLRMEYDCKQERDRLVSFSFHSEPMASGTALSNVDGGLGWADIPPGTLSEVVLKIVCAR